MSSPFHFNFGHLPTPPIGMIDDSNHSNDLKQSKKYSKPPPFMTCSDHQLIGEYKNEYDYLETDDMSDMIKITYNHTYMQTEDSISNHKLINPFVILSNNAYLIRNVPNKLYKIKEGESIHIYKKKGMEIEEKTNFSFHGIFNLFKTCVFGKDDDLHFLTDEEKTEWINPLTCAVRLKHETYFYFIDLSKQLLCELYHSEKTKTIDLQYYPILRMDVQTKIQLFSSPYYN